MSNAWGSRSALVLLLGIAFGGPAMASRAILGIQGLAIGDDEYVAGFDLAYDGWDVIAVCRVLPNWTLTIYNSGHPMDSRIVGEASHGASSLPVTMLDQLKRLFLVETATGAVDSASKPGAVEVGRYGYGGVFRKLVLQPPNVALEPASACPAP
nr:hypothetical protein [uncultured Rhodopila sp.]